MKLLLESLDQIPPHLTASALSIGNFDGVHVGHRKLIECLLATAKRLGVPSIAVTFHPSPATILYPDSVPPALTWLQRRAQMLHDLGVDIVVALPTDRPLLNLTATEFFERVLVERLRCRAVVEGPNFRFGKDRVGDVVLMQSLCKSIGGEFVEVPVERNGEDWVSSSRIRKLLAEGELRLANAMLIEPYRIRGVVRSGAGRGTGIGFPTANLEEIDVLIPKLGVYAGRSVIDGKSYRAAINIGANPTFGEMQLKVEAHFLDAKLDLVGELIEVELIERLRATQKFESLQQLQQQLDRDIANVRAMDL